MKKIKTTLPLLSFILFSTIFGCKKEYERPDQYSIDLFENERRKDNQGITHKEALELSKAFITTDSIQLLDSYNKDNNSFYIYKIANGKIEKETNDTIKFPINILSTTKINKTNNMYNLYLQPLSAYKLMVKEFNIEYQTLNEVIMKE
ncbi:hypothetical protein [Empedobacter sedimenti]|uniref:hypothetical protein n=1 Tax=Empedobacter sedimenti TaxID=3042610 RepID=UPI0024A6DF11|nr:hypothetical protein [Empedobacter sedimenti]